MGFYTIIDITKHFISMILYISLQFATTYHILLKPHYSHVSSAIKDTLAQLNFITWVLPYFNTWDRHELNQLLQPLYLEFYSLFKFLCNS